MENNVKFKWAKFILFLAALYNIFWGGMVLLFPATIFYGDHESIFLDIILRCVGMLVGVYGIAYYFASLNPSRYWPLILVGFLGKALGPFGTIYYIIKGELSASFLVVNVFNDLIWLLPFGWILFNIYKGYFNFYDNKESEKSLYQKILQDNYNNLSPNLKAFHQSKVPIVVTGFFKVERGASSVTRFIAKISNLPKACSREEVELLVIPTGDMEIWNRRIGDNMVKSIQWQMDDMLVEKFGIIKMFLSAEVQDGNLIIKDVCASLLEIPLPPFFTPTVVAKGQDCLDGVDIDVDISLIPFGRLIRYSGIVKVVN